MIMGERMGDVRGAEKGEKRTIANGVGMGVSGGRRGVISKWVRG